MKMASAPDLEDSRNDLALELFGKDLRLLTPEEMDMLDEEVERLMQKFMADGGRVLKQTGGITETRQLSPEFIEAAQKTFLTDLTRQTGTPTVTTATTQQPGETAEQFAQRQALAQQFGIRQAGMAALAPQVAPETQLQIDARTQAQDAATGLGSFQPFLTKATTAADAATSLIGPMTAAERTAYMSPFQQDVIDTTLTEFDRQAQAQQAQQAARALGTPGAFGGGREGVLQAEYQAASDRNRAAIQSGLLQQGFQQAQQAARALGTPGAFGGGREGVLQAEYQAASDRNRAAIQSGLLQQGFQQAQQSRAADLAAQRGVAALQSGLGAQQQALSRGQISGLGTLGAAQQAQQQAILDAQRQSAQMAITEPQQRLSTLGAGVMGITPGAGSIQIADTPAASQASPLTTGYT